MKRQSFVAKATFTWPPSIHDEDAASAIQARFKECPNAWAALRKLKGIFLDSIANPSSGEISESQAKSIVAVRADKNLMGAFARAMDEGRMPPFSKIENYILQNWRTVKCSDGEDLPGLWEWGPSAVTSFLAILGIATLTPEAYIMARRRLGLKPRPIVVVGAYPRPDGKIAIETKD